MNTHVKINIWNTGNAQLTDAELVERLLQRDERVSYIFFYQLCRPLFASIFNRYYTDCESVDELIGEIYLFIMHPGPATGRSKLEAFSFKCSFALWLKIVAENYCKQLFALRGSQQENISSLGDRIPADGDSFEEISVTDSHDVERLLAMMPNDRYRRLIQLRYLEDKTNEETAQLLSMEMANYYNKHKLAKAQFCEILRKEGLL